jgi:conjugal transfer ATP-binding protein TraC
MADLYKKDENRFNKDFSTPLAEKFKERSDLIGGQKIQDIQSEVEGHKQHHSDLRNKERSEDTETTKRNPIENIISKLLSPFKKTPEKSKEQLLEERENFSQRIEGLSVEDLISPVDMEVDFNDVQIGDRYFRTIFVSGYPRFVGPNWLSPIINFEHSIRISTFYYPVDSKVILEKLKRKIGEFEATLYSQMEGRKAVDPSIKVALSDAQNLQNAIAEGTEKFFHFAMYVTIQAKDKKELEKIARNAIATFASMNVTAKQALLQQEQGIHSTQPLGLDKLYITRNMDTTSLATTFPFVTSELTMDHGIMYGINQHNRSLVIFDRFDMENANAVVFAKSGAGKSYYVKLEALRSLMLGAEVIIIDPENEYDRLCTAVNGSYISFSQGDGDKMNPFELSGLGDEEDDELRMKLLSLQGFFKIMFGKLTSVELAILDRALILTYREKGITLDPKTQRNANYPLMEDLYKVLKGMADKEARSLASRLERYIIGSAAGIFNEKSTVELNNPFSVFSIRDMPDELRPMVMYLMLDFIWTKIRKDQRRRILIVDEAWYMMQSEDSAKFLYAIAKRARKYYLGLSTITQDVDDFLKNDMGRAIITNSAMQFLMKQSPTAIERLKTVFNLSEGESGFLLNADKGHGLFFAGNNHVAIQVISSQMEHELITTDPKDLEIINKKTEEKRTLDELAQMYSPPAMQKAMKSGVAIDQGSISKAVSSRKESIKGLLHERIDVMEDQKFNTPNADTNPLPNQVTEPTPAPIPDQATYQSQKPIEAQTETPPINNIPPNN